MELALHSEQNLALRDFVPSLFTRQPKGIVESRENLGVCMVKALFRFIGETFVVIVFVGIGSILMFMLYATRLQILLPLFVGPFYLFFVLVGSGLGYVINRRKCSTAALWVWILPLIWAYYLANRDLSSGIHEGESTLGYIWNTLILGNHEYGLISQSMIGGPFFGSVAYSFGAWLAIRRIRKQTAERYRCLD